MSTAVIIWLGCGALAVIIVFLLAISKKFEKKVEDISLPQIFDLKMNFFGPHTGWHGTFCDGAIVKNAILVGVEEHQVECNDIVCVFVSSIKEGLWQATPLKLSHLAPGKVVATGEHKGNLWKIIYPNSYGIAIVGWIDTTKELRANKKYAAVRKEGNYFELS